MKTPDDWSDEEFDTECDPLGIDPLKRAMNKRGITAKYLARKLHEEMEAKITLPDGRGAPAWSVRQKGRMDAHRLLGHYPADRKELTGPDGKDLFPVQRADLSESERKALQKAAEVYAGALYGPGDPEKA